MNPGAWSILGIVVASLLAGLGWLIRWSLTRTPTTPETGHLTMSQAWELTNKGVLAANAGLVGEVSRLSDRVQTLEESRASLESEVIRLSAMESMLQRAYRYIHTLVEWGRAGGGGEPPEPPEGFVIPDDPTP